MVFKCLYKDLTNEHQCNCYKVIICIIGNGESLRVAKVEPWNSVRVTFTIQREAAQRLRQLAQAGDATLQQLGILSVQVEGDQVSQQCNKFVFNLNVPYMITSIA